MYNILRYLVTAIFLATVSLPAQTVPVTAVEGESWLEHLHRPFNETSMENWQVGTSSSSTWRRNHPFATRFVARLRSASCDFTWRRPLSPELPRMPWRGWPRRSPGN